MPIITRRRLIIGTAAMSACYRTGILRGAATTVPLSINAADYGVRADGSTDNASALMALRADLLLAPGSGHEIILPEGTVLSSQNRWLYGVKDAHVRGTGFGTTLRSLYKGRSTALRAPLIVGDFFKTNTMEYVGAFETHFGHRFNTAFAGSDSITLRNAADAAKYAVGNRVFLYGYERMFWGYPPCVRYFEWRKIKEVSGAVLTLEAPLEDSYDEDWHDVPNYGGPGHSVGKPRIVNLDRNDYTYPNRLEFTRITFGNPIGGGPGGAMFVPCDHLVMNDCHAEDVLWPSCNRIAEYRGGSATSYDIDKCVGAVTFTNHKFLSDVFAATSVKSLTIEGGTIRGAVRVEAVNVVLRGVSIYPTDDTFGCISTYPRRFACDRYVIENLILDASGTPRPIKGYINFLGRVQSFKVDAVSGTSMLLNQDSWDPESPAARVISALGYGFAAHSQDGSKHGNVTRIWHNGSQFVIEGTWPGPKAGETWTFRPLMQFINNGGHIIRDGKPLMGRDPPLLSPKPPKFLNGE